MKRYAALFIAALMLLMSIPALAVTGFVSDPGLPEIKDSSAPIFTAEIRRVEDEPEVSEDEWGDEVFTWVYMDNAEPIAAGDTVTVACEVSVPAEYGNIYDAEPLEALEALFTFEGLDNIELVDATGCERNTECDFEHGYCQLMPGYADAFIEGDTLTVNAHVGKSMQVIISGTATAEQVNCGIVTTMGQYRLPAHFTCGKLVKEGNTYYAYYKDIHAVQIRGMKFVAENGHIADMLVCFNGHDYHRVLNTRGEYKYVEVVDGEETDNVVTEGVKYDALELAYATYMDFFGFTADNESDVLTDGVFLYGSEVVRYSDTAQLGGGEPEPSEEPAPTDEPSPVAPPKTGAVSLTALGIVAVVSGAATVMGKRRK